MVVGTGSGTTTWEKVQYAMLGDGRLSLQIQMLTTLATQAPPSFQPPPSFMSGSATTAATAGAASTPQKKEMDLITRYNLQSRVRETTGEDGGEETAMQQKKQAQGWTSDKVERQKVLLARRDEMILKARRRMEEKDRKEKVEEGSGS